MIRLDLYAGLRREVVWITMPFGQVPKGFLYAIKKNLDRSEECAQADRGHCRSWESG